MPCDGSTGVCVELVDYTRPCWRLAAAAAKMSASTRSTRDALSMDAGRAEEWIRTVMLHGYTSVLEHCKYTFEVVCSRACSHQLVRHRVASYTQQSQRRSTWPVDEAVRLMTGVKPGDRETWGMVSVFIEKTIDNLICYDAFEDEACCEERLGKPCSQVVKQVESALLYGFVRPPSIDTMDWIITTLEALRAYTLELSRGVPPEDARYLLPQSVKTRVLVTMNARELLEVFLPLRLCTRAQWEIRTVAWLLLRELRRVEPLLWRWAGPRCVRLAQLAGAECTLDDLLGGRCRLPLARCPEGVPARGIPVCVRSANTRIENTQSST